MTDDELRKLAEAATPGPWEASVQFGHGPRCIAQASAWSEEQEWYVPEEAAFGEVDDGPNAAFIAAVSPDVVLGLLDRIAALEAGPAPDTFVYGWGRAKHIPHPSLTDVIGRPVGLCGAHGGNKPTPSRPTCKRCLAITAVTA